jgi:hypothetical protein
MDSPIQYTGKKGENTKKQSCNVSQISTTQLTGALELNQINRKQAKSTNNHVFMSLSQLEPGDLNRHGANHGDN